MFNLLKNRTVVVATLIAIILIIYIIATLSVKPPTGPEPTPKPSITPTPIQKTQKVSLIQKTIIGQTANNEIDKLPSIQKKEVLPNGDIKYELSAFIPQRPNEIITHNNVAIFERIDVPENPGQVGYITIAQMTSKYGQPEKIFKGSSFFGPFESTYVYSNLGFAFIGNPYTDEVHEIQVFTSISVDQYVKTYGSDIKEGALPAEESF